MLIWVMGLLSALHVAAAVSHIVYYTKGDDGWLNIIGLFGNVFAAFVWGLNVYMRLP